MVLKAKDVIVTIRKGLVSSIRIFFRSSCRHPFVWSFVFILLLLYGYHPSLFAFLVSSLPIVVCTAVLLGTLLIYGDANVPEIEGDEASQNVVTDDYNVFSNDDNFPEKIHAASKSARSVEDKDLGAKPTLDDQFGSNWQPADGRDTSSGSESDHAESSSADTSVSDIIPLLDELHPLLDPDAPQAGLRSVDNSDVASSGTSQDQESDDGSAEEETEIQEDEEDEAQEKDDANEVVIKWTADDQKNVMDLGTSELERNQRLENLIAKRRARKFLSFHAEKNLIDLDSNDPTPSMEDLSRFNFQIPSISAPRRNPFDIPFEEETIGLPPIPGSAPPVLQPRQNPFDVPDDQGDENSNLTRMTMNHQEFVPTPQMFFRGPENFAMGASPCGDTKLEAHDSILKPYFVPEMMDSEVSGYISFQKESTKMGDSKVRSDHESGTTSSDTDHEDHKELVEPEVHPENHLLPLASHYAEPVGEDSQSSEEVGSVDAPHEQIGMNQDINMVLNVSNVAEEACQTADAFGAVEMEIRQGEYNSPDSDAEKLEVIEERYDDSSSSSSDAYENYSEMSPESSNAEQGRDKSMTYPDDSVQSVSADSDLSRETERIDDSQVVDPVYDSSPSAVEKSLSNSSTFEDALLLAGKEGSAQRPHDNKVSSEERLLESDNGGIWVPPSSLSFVDKNESRSREITEIRERDVIQAGLSGTNEDFGHPLSSVLPKFVLPSRLSLVGTDSSDNAVGRDAIINSGASSKSYLTAKPLTPREVPSILKSDRAGLSTVDLPPILEEHPEHL